MERDFDAARELFSAAAGQGHHGGRELCEKVDDLIEQELKHRLETGMSEPANGAPNADEAISVGDSMDRPRRTPTPLRKQIVDSAEKQKNEGRFSTPIRRQIEARSPEAQPVADSSADANVGSRDRTQVGRYSMDSREQPQESPTASANPRLGSVDTGTRPSSMSSEKSPKGSKFGRRGSSVTVLPADLSTGGSTSAATGPTNADSLSTSQQVSADGGSAPRGRARKRQSIVAMEMETAGIATAKELSFNQKPGSNPSPSSSTDGGSGFMSPFAKKVQNKPGLPTPKAWPKE